MAQRNFSITWRGKDPTAPTDWEMHDSCIANAEEAARAEAAARERYGRSAAGTKECLQAKLDIDVAIADQKHWRQMASDYRKSAAAAPALPALAAPRPAPRPLAPDPRVPEPDDPEDISTFGGGEVADRDVGADELEPGEDWRAAAGGFR